MKGGYLPVRAGRWSRPRAAMTAMPASWTTAEDHRTAAVNVEQLSADRSPQQADDDEQEAGRPDVHRTDQLSGNGGGEPPLHAVAGEHAVMRGKRREQQHIRRSTPPHQLAAPDGQGRPRTTRRRQSASRRTPPRRARRTTARIWSLGLTGHLVNHRASMTERIVITGIGVVSPFGVGRDRFWQHVSRGCSGTRAITEFDASDFALPRRGAGHRRHDRRCAAARRRRHLGSRLPRGSEALLARRADRRDRRARGVGRRRAAHRRAERRRRHRQRRRRHRRRRAAVLRLLRRARQEGHAVRDSGVDRRHGLERDLDLAAPARRQPRAVVRLHELDRRDRLRRGAAALGRRRRDAVRRHRRLRDARDDLRLLADESGVDGLQRRGRRKPRGRSTRGATASCSAKARGCSCSSARIARARAARRSTRRSTATRSTCDAYHRVQMAPDGEEIVRAIDAGDRTVGAPRRRRSATSTITARRRS